MTPWLEINYYVTKMWGHGFQWFHIFKKKKIYKDKKDPGGHLAFAY